MTQPHTDRLNVRLLCAKFQPLLYAESKDKIGYIDLLLMHEPCDYLAPYAYNASAETSMIYGAMEEAYKTMPDKIKVQTDRTVPRGTCCVIRMTVCTSASSSRGSLLPTPRGHWWGAPTPF